MKKMYLLSLAVGAQVCLLANNIQLANPFITGQNTTSKFSLIGFDVSWENSWRLANNESNWDAAWIFVKFRKKGASGWQHATLNATGHTAATGAAITTSPDGKGVFLYRSDAGTGNVDFAGNTLRWNYGADAVLDSDSVEVNVFATEMVYVTPGGFWLGSNGDETAHFRRGDKDTAYWVGSEATINTGVSNTTLFNSSGGISGTLGTIPAAYPKGVSGFYCMKYEVSQQQYADFLNNIDLARANNRNTGYVTGTHPNFAGQVPERALEAASVADAIAYLDWAALRPMTELEFEKACRGTNISPVANEFAFGNTSATPATLASVINPATNNETVGVGNLNVASAVARNLRTGIFATGSSTRVSSGGTYYGVMEMSGNSFEYVISAGNATGRTFTGLHGDGNLNVDGETDMTNGVNAASSWGVRGGSYNSSTVYARTSDRYFANSTGSYTQRIVAYGIRGVRTAQ
jgi:formylglycine-generating enzyme required for sulfatase activity